MDSKQKELLENSKTHGEITGQPRAWRRTLEVLREKEGDIDAFMRTIAAKAQSLVVLFVGAGTSEFIGNIACEYFSSVKATRHHAGALTLRFESNATTDIVSESPIYEEPLLVVSFARSGSSPESVAAVEKLMQKNKCVYNLVLTCNPEGALSQKYRTNEEACVVEFPHAHDEGFAMTASFTSMLLASYFIFSNPQEREVLVEQLDGVIALSEESINNAAIDALLEKPFDRIVYLGTGMFSKMAQEAALKILELTAGKIAAVYNTPLGFRHGPKSFVNENTLVMFFVSSDLYKQKYDWDLLQEMMSDDIGSIEAIVPENFSYEYKPFFKLSQDLPDHLAVLPYIACAQMLALKQSAFLYLTPDNPFPTGTVNRVVKGVKIYEE